MSVQIGEWKDKKLYIEGLEYTFPKQPPKKEMLNYGVPTKDQVWKRVTEYENYYWGEGWEEMLDENEDQLRYLVEEIDRIKNGCWVLINGEAVYINNYMYFFLQWYLLEDGEYPQFRDSALYYYRFIEICDKAKMCTGHTLLKARRLGATSMTLSALQMMMLTNRNSNFGIVSNKGNNANKAFQRVVKSMGNLPAFLRPIQEGNTAPKKVLSLKEQAKRISKDNKTGSAQSGLNNELSWENTDLNSYDSYALRGLLVDECLSPETKIMMGDGSFKPIDEVQVGDYVMTEGSVPRKVMKRFDGYDDMYIVKQPYGKDYKVNSKHRLIIEHRMGGGNRADGRYILTPEELLTKFPKSSYRVINRVVSKGVEFKRQELPIEPYLLGLWLGDGLADAMGFIVNNGEDPEILEYLVNYCDENNNGNYSINILHNTDKAVRFNILKRDPSRNTNPEVTKLKQLNLYDNKHIPEIYMKSTIEDRLQVLAGIIDTDGYNALNYKTRKPKGSFVIAMSRLELIEQIQYLAMSCGLSVSEVRHKKSNFNTNVYKISISGDLERIPTLVKRKQYKNYSKQYNSRRSKISVEHCGKGRYVGIQVEAYEDDHRQLILEDFTLTMNCGKYPKEVPFDKYLPIVIKTLKKGARVVGKLMAPTTCNPPQDGGLEYREVWDNSDQSKADSLGQTVTGLYRIFIPAYIGFDGWITKYGQSIYNTPTPEQVKLLEEMDCPSPYIGAKEYLENTRKQKENTPEDLQEEIRMNPFSADEVFESANERCIFNIHNLNKREQELVDQLLDRGLSVKTGELGRRGWFRMRGNNVVFEDDPVEGLWYVHYMPPPDKQNLYRFVGNNEREPLNESFGAGGLDGYFSGQARVDAGSDGAVIIRSRKTTSLPDEYSGVPVAMLLGHMEDIDAFYEQAYNGLIFYGVKMLAERAQLYFEEYARKNKLLRYLYSTTRSDGSVVYGIPAQQSKTVIEEHARVQVMSSLDDHYKIPFINVIRDRKVFNVKSRTSTDVSMAEGYSLMALEYPIKEIKKANTGVRYLRKGKIII